MNGPHGSRVGVRGKRACPQRALFWSAVLPHRALASSHTLPYHRPSVHHHRLPQPVYSLTSPLCTPSPPLTRPIHACVSITALSTPPSPVDLLRPPPSPHQSISPLHQSIHQSIPARLPHDACVGRLRIPRLPHLHTHTHPHNRPSLSHCLRAHPTALPKPHLAVDIIARACPVASNTSPATPHSARHPTRAPSHSATRRLRPDTLLTRNASSHQ